MTNPHAAHPPQPPHDCRDSSLLAALSKLTKTLQDLAQAKHDALTLALRLYSESSETFSPETAEVMDRYRPICKQLIESPDLHTPFCPACLSHHPHLTLCLTPH